MMKKTLLFVDDEKRILRTLKALFRSDYTVHTANSGLEAIDILKNTKIHVLISDQRMPVMTGSELLSQARVIQPQTIRLLLTGYMDKQAIVDTINDGEIHRFINKPWDIDNIRKIIGDAAKASEIKHIDEFYSNDNKKKEHLQQLINKQGGQPPSVVIIEKDQSTRNEARLACKDLGFKIYSANSIGSAINSLNANKNIGIALISYDNAANDFIATINLTHKARPDLSICVLTDMTDSQVGIDLINYGQVFKYLTKPIERSDLRNIILDSGIRHCKLKENSIANKRYKSSDANFTIASSLRKLFSIFETTASKR